MSANTCNPPATTEDEDEGMKGDAIGSTMYSERWILKILMQLTKLSPEEWTSDLENELCVLWDMSADEDVVQMLMQHNMFGLASYVIVNIDNSRLTEIMVGIIGNMCCIKSVRTALGSRTDVVDVLLELLSLPDVPILLQVLRVFQTCAWDVKNRHKIDNQHRNNQNSREVMETEDEFSAESKLKRNVVSGNSESDDVNMKTSSDSESHEKCNELSVADEKDGTTSSETSTEIKDLGMDENHCANEFWLQYFMKVDSWLPRILFILSSSKDDELLSSTWSFLSTVCYIPVGETVLSQHVVDADLMMAMLESYKECFEESFKSDDIEPVKKAAGHWISVLYSFTLHKESVEILCQFKNRVFNCIFNMLHYCHLIFVLDEELATFITSSLAVLDVIFFSEPQEWSHYSSGLLTVIKLWEQLSASKSVKCSEDMSTQLEEETMKALREFFISVHKCLEENKHDDTFKKLHSIHKELTQLLNSTIT